MNTNQITDIKNNQQLSRFFGKYRGTVSDNQDPKNIGRIKAKVPEVLGDVETGWALPCLPYSGNGSGTYSVPEPEAGVWIEFEAGDVSRPLWSGCWWKENQLPENNGGTMATPPLKIIRSEKGLMVAFDDNSQEITLSDENGSNMVTITVTDGKVKIQGATKVVVEAPHIELVENASHPVIFGDRLIDYLKLVKTLYEEHLHPGELCLGVFPVVPEKPVPPLLEPQSMLLLSRKVTSG